MVWHRPASQPDLLTLFKQEMRFGSQINGTTNESKPAGKHLDETPPKSMPLQMSVLLLKSPYEHKQTVSYVDGIQKGKIMQTWKYFTTGEE